MNTRTFLLVLACVLLLWPAGSPTSPLPSVDAFELMQNEGLVAITVNLEEKSDTARPVSECKCNGTGKVKSPDGITDITCQCGSNCTCQSRNVNPEVKVCPKCGRSDCPSLGVTFVTTMTANKVPFNANLTQQVLFFTSKTCPPCTQWKENEKPKLETLKFVVSTEEKAHVLIVDSDENPELVARYNVTALPSFVKLERGRETFRYIGYTPAQTIANLWK